MNIQCVCLLNAEILEGTHWNIRLAILLLIEYVEIKSKVFRGFAMKHLCPNGSCSFFLLFFMIFSRFLPLLGHDPNKNLEKTNEKKHSNVSGLVPAGLEVFFWPPHFFATFGRRQKESLRASLAVFDRYLHLFVSEMLAFRIQFHCKVVLHIFSFETTRCCKVKEVSNGMADWPAADWGEFIDLMKHSTPFEDGKENGIIGDDSSWVHYNWPEVANDMSSYWRFSINRGFLL